MAENVVVQNASGDDEVYTDVAGVELRTEDGGTATFIHEAEIPKPDWNEQDSSNKNYIRNKPDLAPVATKGTFAALKDKQFHVGDIPSFDSTSLSFVEDTDVFFADLDSFWLVPGESYKVVWDGVEHTCVCNPVKDLGGFFASDEKGSYLGNGAILNNSLAIAPDTQEPFLVLDANTGRPAIGTTDTAAKHTVSITPVNPIKKLDKKYLPDDLDTGGTGGDTGGAASGGDIPLFDLVALGLPAVEPDGDGQVVAFDTTELIAALNTGLVKLTIAVNLEGMQIPATAVCTGFSALGGWGVYITAWLLDSPVMAIVEIMDNGVEVSIVSLKANS